jgi:signal peptidase I
MNEKHRIPAVAVLCSLMLDPGLGFVYNGNLKKGLLVSIGFLAIFFAIFTLGLLQSVVGAILVIMLMIFPGYRFVASVLAWRDASKAGTIPLRRYNSVIVYLLYPSVSILLVLGVVSISSTHSFKVLSGAMEPTIAAGDYIVVDMKHYQKEDIRPGDVIVFRFPRDPRALWVKRCVALGGQVVQIRDAILYVDGQRFMPSLVCKRSSNNIRSVSEQDSTITPSWAGNIDQYGPVVVPEGAVFTLGDWRDNSNDSRFFGSVRKDDVVGKALYVYWSENLSRLGLTIK